MTDPNPPTELDEIVVIGQRRRYHTDLFPSGGWEGAGETGGLIRETGDADQGGGDNTDPCANPETALDWNADAAAAEAAREFERRASTRNPPETLNNREWGVALFEMPDGRVVLGNITHSAYTFQNPGPDGRVSVAIDWTAPAGGVLVGMAHSHSAGSHLPSGSSPTSDDQDSLRYIRDVRSQIGLNPDQARIYIIALTTGPAGASQYAKVSVYNHQNQQAAIAGTEGPEVNPEAQPCP